MHSSDVVLELLFLLLLILLPTPVLNKSGGSRSGGRGFGGGGRGWGSSGRGWSGGGSGSVRSRGGGWFGRSGGASGAVPSGGHGGAGWFGRSGGASGAVGSRGYGGGAGGWFGRGAGSHTGYVGPRRVVYPGGGGGMAYRGMAIPPRPLVARGGYIYNARRAHALHYGPMRMGFVHRFGYYGYPGLLMYRTMPIAMFIHRPIIYPCCPFIYYPLYHRHYFYGYSNYNERFYNATGDDKPVSDAPIVCRYNITDDDPHFNNVTFENGTKVEEIVYECDADSEYCCDGLDCCKREDQGWTWWQVVLAVIGCIVTVLLCLCLCYFCAVCCCDPRGVVAAYNGGSPIAGPLYRSPVASPIYDISLPRPSSPIAYPVSFAPPGAPIFAQQQFVPMSQQQLLTHFPPYLPSSGALPLQQPPPINRTPGFGNFSSAPSARCDPPTQYGMPPVTLKRPIGFNVEPDLPQTNDELRNRSEISRESNSQDNRSSPKQHRQR